MPHSSSLTSLAFAAELNSDTPEIDLHGLSADEGVRALEHELHHQFFIGSTTLRVMHGRGSGALRDAVRAYLKREPLVAYSCDAQSPAQQGAMTIVVLHSR